MNQMKRNMQLKITHLHHMNSQIKTKDTQMTKKNNMMKERKNERNQTESQKATRLIIAKRMENTL